MAWGGRPNTELPKRWRRCKSEFRQHLKRTANRLPFTRCLATMISMPKAKAKPVASKIFAVVGSDDVEVKQTATGLVEKLKPKDAGEFGLETIDGAADNADQAATRIRSTIDAL